MNKSIHKSRNRWINELINSLFQVIAVNELGESEKGIESYYMITLREPPRQDSFKQSAPTPALLFNCTIEKYAFFCHIIYDFLSLVSRR